MFIRVGWFGRHMRQVRLACMLCLIVFYSTLLLGIIPIIAYFDQHQDPEALAYYVPKIDELPSVPKLDELPSVPKMDKLPSVPAMDKLPSVPAMDKLPSVPKMGKLPSVPKMDKLPSVPTMDKLPSVPTKDRRHTPQVSTSREAEPKLTPWNISESPPMLALWKRNRLDVCDGGLELYSSQFARLRNVIVDRQFCVARAHGGEDVSSVLSQDEYAEYYNKIKHCFQLKCKDANRLLGYHFSGVNFLNDWLVNTKTAFVETDHVTIEPGFTVALMRREYANLYHTVNDWYNIFLLMVLFDKQPAETNVILVDAHPKGKLDPVWSVLFNSSRMLSELPPRSMFRTMVWGMQGYNSVLKDPFQFNKASPLLLEEFRRFFLDRFQLNEAKQLNCSKVSVLFIWRHDYLAHPRNPSGVVQRKIGNEEELLSALRARHPNYSFRGVQIDAFEMKDQLRLVTEADILIGMHGAGLSHTLFVPLHGGMIELFPNYYMMENNHFFDLARLRGLAGARWVNMDYANEMGNYQTRIPIETIDDLLGKMVAEICTESAQKRLEGYRAAPPMPLRGSILKDRNNMEVAGVRRWDAKPVEGNRIRARRL